MIFAFAYSACHDHGCFCPDLIKFFKTGSFHSAAREFAQPCKCWTMKRSMRIKIFLKWWEYRTQSDKHNTKISRRQKAGLRTPAAHASSACTLSRQHKTPPKPIWFRRRSANPIGDKLSLGELRCTTCRFETVLT